MTSRLRFSGAGCGDCLHSIGSIFVFTFRAHESVAGKIDPLRFETPFSVLRSPGSSDDVLKCFVCVKFSRESTQGHRPFTDEVFSGALYGTRGRPVAGELVPELCVSIVSCHGFCYFSSYAALCKLCFVDRPG